MCMHVCASRVAQWKRAGPITQRSMDRYHPLLLSPFLLSGIGAGDKFTLFSKTFLLSGIGAGNKFTL